ncbi:hypothetical protein Arno162_137 [Pectobacterium phage Arno162]|uniref:Uncharacterized protein n=1 Tax=Pectobacterium phage Arno162 TaxID=2500577 RepID=A0A678ZZD0_9CAUD|nr:hypothetical protein Arno162_137 [Pectobacterium phage Arno162]
MLTQKELMSVLHYDAKTSILTLTQAKWRVSFWVKSKQVHIGLFTNFDDAVSAARKKRQELYGEFSNSGDGNELSTNP